MKEYDVETMEDLDEFDAMEAYFESGEEFCVNVVETRGLFYPVFYIRENGDVDGLIGWNE
jgi:hypothetical protein